MCVCEVQFCLLGRANAARLTGPILLTLLEEPTEGVECFESQ